MERQSDRDGHIKRAPAGEVEEDESAMETEDADEAEEDEAENSAENNEAFATCTHVSACHDKVARAR